MLRIKAFQDIRQQLDNLSYREPLSPDSLPLAQHLLSDLLKKSEDFHNASSELEKEKKKNEQLTVCVAPYQQENGRLLTYLNQLRVQHMKLKEKADSLSADQEKSTKKLEDENEDLRFLVEELKRTLKNREAESRAKSNRILELQEKNLGAVISTPGGKKKPIAVQKQRMEMSSLLPPSVAHSKCLNCGCDSVGVHSSRRNALRNGLKAENVYLADILKLTDQKLLDLQKELDRERKAYIESEDHCEVLNRKIANRDAEIERLQGLLQGGRSVEAIIEDNRLQAAHSHLHQMQVHIDMLTKTNVELKKKLKGILGETHEAMNRAMTLADENKALSRELDDDDIHRLHLDVNRLSVPEFLAQKLMRSKDKLETCETELAEQHRLYHLMQDDRDRLQEQLGQLRHDYSHLMHSQDRFLKEKGRMSEENRQLEERLHRLQDERRKMVDKVNHLTAHAHEDDTTKAHLLRERNALETTCEQMQGEKIKEADAFLKKQAEIELERNNIKEEVSKLKYSNRKLEKDLEHMKKKIEELEDERDILLQAKDFYTSDIGRLKSETSNLQDDKENLDDEYTKLEQKKEEIEKERDYYSGQVIQLLDVLKARPSSTPSPPLIGQKLSPDEHIARLRQEREVLKQERDFYKAQCQSLKNQQQIDTAVIHRPIRGGPSGHFPVPGKTSVEFDEPNLASVKRERDFFRQQADYFQRRYNETLTRPCAQRPSVSASETDRSAGSQASLGIVQQLESDLSHAQHELQSTQQELQVLQQEREFYLNQYEKLKADISQGPIIDEESEDLDIGNLIRERNVLCQERDFFKNRYNEISKKLLSQPEMSSVLNEKKEAMVAKAELQVKVLNLEEEVKELENEKQVMDRQMKELNQTFENMQNAALKKFPPSTQEFINEIRKARDTALADLDAAKRERDQLRTKLKALTAQQVREKATAQEEQSQLRYQKGESDQMTSDMHQRLTAQSELISSLQDQIETLQSALQKANVELGTSGKKSTTYKKALEEKLSHLGEQEQQLEAKDSELLMARNQVKELEKEVHRLTLVLTKLEAEANTLRNNLGTLDKDKDTLLNQLDSKTEHSEELKKEIIKKDAIICGLEAVVASLEGKLAGLDVALGAEGKKLGAEEERSQRLTKDLTTAVEGRNVAEKEIRRLQKEVATLVQDCKNLKCELEKAQSARENFKRKAQEYCKTLEDITLLMSAKDEEQATLRKQYLNLNEAVVSLKSLNASLEESVSSRDQQLGKVETMLAKFQEERQQLVDQLMQASKRMEDLEGQCSQLEQDKFRAENDLIQSRDFSQKLDGQKGEAEGELRRLASAMEKLIAEKHSLEQQICTLKSQLQKERASVKSLEEILSEKRKAEWALESTNKQLDVEKTQLLRQISDLQRQLEDEISEAKRLRARAAQTSTDIECLKRELTNEQYERDRANQELRRVQKFSQMIHDIESSSSSRQVHSSHMQFTPFSVSSSTPSLTPSPQQGGAALSSDPLAFHGSSHGVATTREQPLPVYPSTSSDTGIEKSQPFTSVSSAEVPVWTARPQATSQSSFPTAYPPCTTASSSGPQDTGLPQSAYSLYKYDVDK